MTPLKRTEEDGHYDYLTIEEEAEELDQLLDKAINKSEELIDILYIDNAVKCALETLRAINFLRRERKYAHGIDRFKQEIHRLLMNYEK